MAGSIYRVFDNGEGVQVAVGAGGLLWTSEDAGISWDIRNSGTTEDLYGVAYGTLFSSDAFVVVGSGGTILTSSNLSLWVTRTSFTTSALYDVAYSGVFMAVGAGGALGVSDDLGVTWEAKASGTVEDLIDVTADLGGYIIVGTNDTVLTGDIATLETEILVVDGVGVSAGLASQVSFQREVTEELVAVSEESWTHDALGAGTTITVGGTNQFVYLTEGIYGVDLPSSPTGSYNHTLTDSATLLITAVPEHFRVSSADLVWPMFEVSGEVALGRVLTGDIAWPMFTTSGALDKPLQAAVTWPMFEVSGGIDLAFEAVADIVWPMFQVVGSIASLTATDDGSYEVWVVNQETGAHSTYTLWPANSYGVFNGAEIIATSEGLFTLGGTDDAGVDIPVKVYWPPSKFGTDKQKRIEQPIVDRREGGDFSLVTVTDETEKRIYGQDLTGFPEGMYPKRVSTTRNLKGRYWQFGIESATGGGLTVKGLEVGTITLSRKLK
jgi:hypothetical protein